MGFWLEFKNLTNKSKFAGLVFEDLEKKLFLEIKNKILGKSLNVIVSGHYGHFFILFKAMFFLNIFGKFNKYLLSINDVQNVTNSDEFDFALTLSSDKENESLKNKNYDIQRRSAPGDIYYCVSNELFFKNNGDFSKIKANENYLYTRFYKDSSFKKMVNYYDHFINKPENSRIRTDQFVLTHILMKQSLGIWWYMKDAALEPDIKIIGKVPNSYGERLCIYRKNNPLYSKLSSYLINIVRESSKSMSCHTKEFD